MIKRLVVKPLLQKVSRNKSRPELIRYIGREKEKFNIIKKKVQTEKTKIESAILLRSQGVKVNTLTRKEMNDMENDVTTVYQNILKATARLIEINKVRR